MARCWKLLGKNQALGNARTKMLTGLAAASRIGVRDCDDLQIFDPGEIARIARVHRQAVRHRRRCDHRVIRSGGALASTSPQRGGDLAECSGCSRIKRDWIKVTSACWRCA